MFWLFVLQPRVDRTEEARLLITKVHEIDPKYTIDHFEKSVIVKDQTAKKLFIQDLRRGGLL